ncbi:hypothetical protein BDV37DRAFT_280440 [Aspergillus pseudonomiae]|uniref:Uncharacterized protein n=1 Tax=Aspergillus pseudonomiae TaxID=1506151 RepID=A0A5N7DMV7_9EURO|nr:uncharacterized protein BDV37DRAFT_280440 [Aspergillus pseudonomiae]KAE8406828.1 hypothetical protein BDV37DRAFT_280440 [Aspergillus pseudonomiae]
MDKLMSKLGGGSQSKDKEAEGGSSNDKDYVDKGMYSPRYSLSLIFQSTSSGLDSIEKKFGGGRINPDDPKVRETNEKFTDAARSKLESLTGQKAPSKFSN